MKKPALLKRVLPYVVYAFILGMQIYSLFFYTPDNEKHYMRIIMLIGFIIALIVPIVAILSHKLGNSKRFARFMLGFCIALVLVQIIALPIANVYSETLPAIPPRGSIYQFPQLRNSVSLNELGLFMGYYLDGKTLYALECDDPRDFDNGLLFLSDQYAFKALHTLSVNDNYLSAVKDGSKVYFMGVRKDPKRKIDGFTLHIYVGQDHQSYDEVALLKDTDGNWHIGPRHILLEGQVG